MKNILLISSGLSPQVITETIYFYSQVNKPPIYFDEIHIITEQNGANRIHKSLFGKTGYLNQLINDYNINPDFVKLTKDNIHVIKDSSGEMLIDLQTLSDNQSALNQIFEIVRNMTFDKNSRLFTSIAGGRKTLSVMIGQAMQFYGRKQDRLIHVLVDDKLFNSNEFYYPKPKKTEININGKTIDISKVKVNVNELPFIRLRYVLGDILAQTKTKSISNLVKTAQEQIDDLFGPVIVKVDTSRCELFINNRAVKLPAKNLALYTAFLIKTKKSNEISFVSIEEILSKPFLINYCDTYKNIKGYKNSLYLTEKNRIENLSDFDEFFTQNWLMESKSKVNRILKTSININLFETIKIATKGSYGSRQYGILIKPEHIYIN